MRKKFPVILFFLLCRVTKLCFRRAVMLQAICIVRRLIMEFLLGNTKRKTMKLSTPQKKYEKSSDGDSCQQLKFVRQNRKGFRLRRLPSLLSLDPHIPEEQSKRTRRFPNFVTFDPSPLLMVDFLSQLDFYSITNRAAFYRGWKCVRDGLERIWLIELRATSDGAMERKIIIQMGNNDDANGIKCHLLIIRLASRLQSSFERWDQRQRPNDYGATIDGFWGTFGRNKQSGFFLNLFLVFQSF